MDNLKKPLKNLGFTDKEAAVYMALLGLGQTSYTDLAKASGIKRTTLYSIVRDMQERGVVRYLVDERKLTPTPPERLFRQLQGNALQFYKLIPQLKELGDKRRPISRVQFYSGVEGIKQAYTESDFKKLPPKKERRIRVISDGDVWEGFWQEADHNFTDTYLKETKARGFFWKVLTSGSTSGAYSPVRARQFNFEVKQLPAAYKSEFDMEIHATHLIIADLKSKQPYAIKIISAELAQAMAAFFDFAWQLADGAEIRR